MQVRLAAHKVDADKCLAALALVAMETLAAGVRAHYNTLCPIEALMVVTWAGAWQDHGGRELAE